MATLTLGSSRIEVRERGDGDPVVLLHCSAGSGKIWDPVGDALQSSAALDPIRTIAPDLHGYGASTEWQDPGPLTLGKEAAVVAELAKRVSQPVHLVGHSYGGAVALVAALGHREWIKSLTLIEPVSFHLLVDRDSKDRALLREIRAVAIAVRCGVLLDDPEPGMRRFVDFWNGRGSWDRLPEASRQPLLACAPQVARNFWSVAGSPIRLGDLRSLDLPTRLIAGGRTKPITRRVVDLLERALPWTTRNTIVEAGHMSPVTHPGLVAAAVAGHLDRLQTTRQPTAA